MWRWVFVVIVFLLIEIYAFQAFKTLSKNNWIIKSYTIINVIVFVNFFFRLFNIYFQDLDYSDIFYNYLSVPFALLFTLLCFKLIIISFLFFEDIIRIAESTFKFFFSSSSDSFLTQRREFLSKLAILIASVPIPFVIHGIFKGRYNYRVFNYELEFDDLPDDFDGYRLTHISDIHSGSFDNPDKINYAIDLVNEQNSDLILFTGDIVNTHAKEMHPWIDNFNRIKKHKYGKFSVLGNHDYGEYVTWPSQKAKDENFEAIKNLYGQIDFKLLLNEHTFITKGDDKIALVGVENWGNNFKKAGDINKASANLTQDDFKILMSHDPSHWEYEVKNHEKNFHLTLSGHTHGMQFGIEIPGYFKWSLAQYVYKQWAGLYENKGRYVYVNRGFGFHAYPGRVGIMPEITVIELKKGKYIV